jgi:hypothetical protein
MKITPPAYSLSLLLASSLAPTADAFIPAAFAKGRTSLGVSVVSELILNKEDSNKKVLSTFETETPESVGMKGPGIQEPKTKQTRRKKRKHNYSQQKKFLKEEPDLDFYTLHSSAVSHLYKDIPINDILRAIKRAQNLHDVHDLATIATFLIDGCDEHWGYGFRGSLLSRLAVAALHMNEVDVAMRAIRTRHIYERPSMQPCESAAIVRGLMRTHSVEEGWELLEDELRVPMDGTALDTPENKEMIKHRALSLTSIASRHFYEKEPYVAAKALTKLGELGSFVAESQMENKEMKMPWARLVTASTVCNEKLSIVGSNLQYPDSTIELPSDLTELVWNAMADFHCPGEQEECPLEEFVISSL